MMDDTMTDNVFSFKNDEFFGFIHTLVGQQIVDILKFQSITSTQSLIRYPNIFDIFNMKCSEHDFLSIRKKSCLELDDGQFIVKVGLLNNLNYLLDFLKQEQNKISDDNYMDVDSNLTFDLINKNPLLKNLVLLYQRIGSEGVTNTNKNGFLIDFINTITNNLTKSRNHFRYSDKIKDFALSLYILGGKLTEAEFRFDQLQKHFKNLNLRYAFGSEDATGVIKKIKYDSITNKFIGFLTPLDHGVPIKEYYHTDSLDTLKLWFNSIDKASLLNVHMIQSVQSTTQNTIPSPFLLSAYGIDNTATANDILQRWWYILNQCLQRNIRIIGFATDADAKYVRAMRLMSGFFAYLPNFPFFLREQQLLLFFQDATHLATKWRNRLLSSTVELRLGDQSISINHLYSIIDNAKFTKIDHGLTKSDINPKDRQNFSSCVKLTSDDLFKI
ncbi:unnamed protein product [Rotaria magnacalcarata]|uniref:Uncharacterized protein n=2 Tax=Rotaria magnacalcarata TaxID=392030 RepID=A0A816U521_9BILA|nr:unnamed protein product [Rotaria magnacalcarata]